MTRLDRDRKPGPAPPRRILLCCLACLLLAAADQPPPRLTNTAAGVVLNDEPVTVILAPLPKARFGIEDDAPAVLAFDAVSGRAAQPVRIGVFLNAPGANRQTGPDHPAYLGFLQLMPARGALRPVAYRLELPATGIEPGRPIAITLVPVVGIDSAPTGTAIQIGGLYIARQP